MDIRGYLSELQQQLSSGIAREHAYRPALKTLFESTGLVTAINDPQRSEHGNPDFIFQDKEYSKLIRGYGESKDITISLDTIEKTEQMRRYYGYSNLVLTNGLDFRFYKNGEKYFATSLGFLENNRIVVNEENQELFWGELKNFLQSPPEKIRSAVRLSEIMGGKARRIRENINLYLKKENNELNVEIEKIYKVIKELLVHDLSTEKFADMYAQTLVYGLFVARYHDNTSESFTRQEARDLVPASNPFLRQFFDHIAGPQFDKRLAYIVDELCAVFQVSDIKTIIKQHFRQDSLFGEESHTKDPIIHFYEDFLKEYDSELKKKMGAYYTPVPVVRYMVRAVDDILKTEFGLPKGLADTTRIKRKVVLQGSNATENVHKVQILDPAVGTATFLNELIKYIFENNFKGQEGRWSSYVDEDLIPRLHGFELMMAPYTIAHLKLAMTLKELGYNKEFNKRLGVYLTNTLEEGVKKQLDLLTFGLQDAISKESQAAAEIKHNKPIMVIIGNPPYSGESSNKTVYAQSLVEKYKVEPGGKQKLQERNSKWINDDYVKFIAFSENLINKNNEGVLAMITNHSYIDNPTFRGMRWRLMQSFNKIYILDLHGNSKKKETSPDGSKDENVFDIQQGVAIILAIKTKNSEKLADVYRSDFYGKRASKFIDLSKKHEWKRIDVDKRLYAFNYVDLALTEKYNKFFSISELFTKSTVGIQTHCDAKVLGFDDQSLIKQLENDNVSVNEKLIKKIEYRPFDYRSYYDDPNIVHRPRISISKNMDRENIALCFMKQYAYDTPYSYALVTSTRIIDRVFISNKGAAYFAPLYIYSDDGIKTPNFREEIYRNITKGFNEVVSPEDIIDYIYAVLHSLQYRQKYKEILKTDFPKIPYPMNENIFWKLVKKGSKLRELHQMNDPEIESLVTTYSVNGSNIVEKIEYKENRVFVNEQQYFGNVPEIAWNFYVGGYQPAQKWLKDRKGKTLSSEEIEHYQKIIKVLVETDRTMKEIDQIDFM